MNQPLVLFGVTYERTDTGASVTARLGEHSGNARTITFEISANAELEPVERADAFLPIALLVAMREGRSLHVDGVLSPRLLYHANHYLGEIIHRIHPTYRTVPVTAAETAALSVPDERGVCAGFSCGIDSFAVLQDHFLEPTVPGFCLTHLLFNDVGSHRPSDREGIFRRRLARIRRVAGELDLPVIVTRSNQTEFFGNDFMSFDALRNATVPLLLQGRMKRFYYGAAVTLDDLGVYPNNAVDMAEPALLPLLSTEAIDFVSAGAQYTRIEKLDRLTDVPLARRNLDVCVVSPPNVVNCGGCFKCAPTLFTLEILGKMDAFADLFDLQAYRRARERFIVYMHYSTSTVVRQVKDLAYARRFPIPLHLRIWAWLKSRVFRRMLSKDMRRRFRERLQA